MGFCQACHQFCCQECHFFSSLAKNGAGWSSCNWVGGKSALESPANLASFSEFLETSGLTYLRLDGKITASSELEEKLAHALHTSPKLIDLSWPNLLQDKAICDPIATQSQVGGALVRGRSQIRSEISSGLTRNFSNHLGGGRCHESTQHRLRESGF